MDVERRRRRAAARRARMAAVDGMRRVTPAHLQTRGGACDRWRCRSVPPHEAPGRGAWSKPGARRGGCAWSSLACDAAAPVLRVLRVAAAALAALGLLSVGVIGGEDAGGGAGGGERRGSGSASAT